MSYPVLLLAKVLSVVETLIWTARLADAAGIAGAIGGMLLVLMAIDSMSHTMPKVESQGV